MEGLLYIGHLFWSINKHGHHRQFSFLIGWFLKKYFPMKPLSQMNRNGIGSIYWRSSIKIAHFFTIRLQIWPPQAILVSHWSISKKSSPLKPLCQMNRNLVASIYGRFCIKFPQHKVKGEQHRLSPLSL